MGQKHIYSFEQLRVWQNDKDLVVKVYRITKEFPDEERFGLKGQIRRSAVSVTANIAEGSGRTSPKDQAHFYQMAYSSLLELLNHLYISADLGFIDKSTLCGMKTRINNISTQLNALHLAVK